MCWVLKHSTFLRKRGLSPETPNKGINHFYCVLSVWHSLILKECASFQVQPYNNCLEGNTTSHLIRKKELFAMFWVIQNLATDLTVIKTYAHTIQAMGNSELCWLIFIWRLHTCNTPEWLTAASVSLGKDIMWSGKKLCKNNNLYEISVKINIKPPISFGREIKVLNAVQDTADSLIQ